MANLVTLSFDGEAGEIGEKGKPSLRGGTTKQSINLDCFGQSPRNDDLSPST